MNCLDCLVYWYCYQNSAKGTDRDPQVHANRDGTAFMKLLPALFQKGIDFAGPLFNFPDTHERVDSSYLRPVDLLGMTTRPALDDFIQDDRKKVLRSWTTLEEQVLGVSERYFLYCSRSHVQLQPTLADPFPQL